MVLASSGHSVRLILEMTGHVTFSPGKLPMADCNNLLCSSYERDSSSWDVTPEVGCTMGAVLFKDFIKNLTNTILIEGWIWVSGGTFLQKFAHSDLKACDERSWWNAPKIFVLPERFIGWFQIHSSNDVTSFWLDTAVAFPLSGLAIHFDNCLAVCKTVELKPPSVITTSTPFFRSSQDTESPVTKLIYTLKSWIYYKPACQV